MCETDRAFHRETRREEYEVRGEKIAIDVPRLTCAECGEAVVDEAFGDPVIAVYAEYRRKYDLLTPAQIKAIRDKYDLPQAAFAALLGISPATLARYEGGSLQDKAYDQLLRACENPAFVSDLVRREGHRISSRHRERVEAAIEKLRAHAYAEGLLQWWNIAVPAEAPNAGPLLPELRNFIERTDILASLPEARRRELFFIVALASADEDNPVEPFLRYRGLVARAWDASAFKPFQPVRLSVAVECNVAAAIVPSTCPSLPGTDPWPRPSEVRMLRRLAGRLVTLTEAEAHKSVVELASKRLLKSRWWVQWVRSGEVMQNTSMCLPIPAPLIPRTCFSHVPTSPATARRE